MDYGKEFEKFAIKDQGISSTYYNKIISSMYPIGMTPNIIEERQMNIAVFDVFSRLNDGSHYLYGNRYQRSNCKYHTSTIIVFRKYRCFKRYSNLH